MALAAEAASAWVACWGGARAVAKGAEGVPKSSEEGVLVAVGGGWAAGAEVAVRARAAMVAAAMAMAAVVMARAGAPGKL